MGQVLLLGGPQHGVWIDSPVPLKHGRTFQISTMPDLKAGFDKGDLKKAWDVQSPVTLYRVVQFKSGDCGKTYFAAVPNSEPDWMALDRLFSGIEQ